MSRRGADGLVAGFDETVGVEDEQVTDAEVDVSGLERDAADAERCPGRQVDQTGAAETGYEDRRKVADGGQAAAGAGRGPRRCRWPWLRPDRW
ncbi:hypothetical protein UK12_19930 [Saccharothrix sp. ST-888]|nr:hypothetical protein UK12_19930 [Saccharothrix sp. ST-888]